MAEVEDRELFESDSATPEARSISKKNRGGDKKKKKRRGCGFFILMMLLAAGTAAGLQASGNVDLRPEVYSMLPKIPFAGESLSRLLDVPPEYSLTPGERRRQENDEREAMLAAMSRSLDALSKDLTKVSRDLSIKEQDLDYERNDLAKRLEALSNDTAQSADASLSDSQKEEITNIVGTFGQMSVKNAAAIIEKLNQNLAVAVLDGLAEDTRANVLGRMEAARAAELTERLTELYRNRR
jgi:flagellar motility protein MotE (MotC chaperone)